MQRPSFFQQLGVLCLVLVLAVSQAFAATSLQYTLPGTPVTFADSGGTVVMAFSAKASLSGQVGALYDKTAGAQPSLWQFQCQISLNGTHTPGATLEYYLVTSQDGTTVDGGVSLNAALASADKRRNLIPMGVLVVDQTTNLTSMYATFRNVYIPTRYFTLAFWNATAISTETSTTKHKCVGTPMPPQMQAS